MTTLAPPTNKTSGFWKKTSGILRFVLIHLEIGDKINLQPWKFWKIVLYTWKFQGQNPRPSEIQHYFFWITAENTKQFSFN